ncbi:MAG TPA: gamma-glutamyl-gamma-aminobutyrate hydrolase family protein [Terriglobales bacterium]|nr:gamma-glutamyl-gamma-aminobutyrate hydrolase family protein [Terriglobales bacterium]
MRPRIGIPVPHSGDPEYAARALPQYVRAVDMAGGEPVEISLNLPAAQLQALIGSCHGVLLPGSRADVDPSRFNACRHPATAEPDGAREAVDDALLQEAYLRKKPVFGICYGLQSLNVNRGGTLVQDIRAWLDPDQRDTVNHEAGRKMPVAHKVAVEPGSVLARIVGNDRVAMDAPPAGDVTVREVPVNSSHHQCADVPGEGLRVSARCTADGIVEGLEGTDPDHFVVAVQWHPERSVDEDEPSRAMFRAFIRAAQAWQNSHGRDTYEQIASSAAKH